MTDKAIEFIRGNRGMAVRIAEACDINRTAVYQWERVPIERVYDVAAVIGWTPEQIRPDFFRDRPTRARQRLDRYLGSDLFKKRRDAMYGAIDRAVIEMLQNNLDAMIQIERTKP